MAAEPHDLSGAQKCAEGTAHDRQNGLGRPPALSWGWAMSNSFSPCCSGFSKGTMMSMYFFLSITKT